MMNKAFTGRRMAAIMVAGFGLVVAVNFAMAWVATSTFSGVQVKNSYVASQNFNRWLEEAERVRALGWEVKPLWRKDGRVELRLTGVPAGAQATALLRHPLGLRPDRTLAFVPLDDATLLSTEALPLDRWIIRIEVTSGKDVWRGQESLQ